MRRVVRKELEVEEIDEVKETKERRVGRTGRVGGVLPINHDLCYH